MKPFIIGKRYLYLSSDPILCVSLPLALDSLRARPMFLHLYPQGLLPKSGHSTVCTGCLGPQHPWHATLHQHQQPSSPLNTCICHGILWPRGPAPSKPACVAPSPPISHHAMALKPPQPFFPVQILGIQVAISFLVSRCPPSFPVAI